jgi:hypothetical protein
MIIFTDGSTTWTSAQLVVRPLPKHRKHKYRINTYQTHMPCLEFEPTIPAFEPAKTVHALDRSATVTGSDDVYLVLISRKTRH